MAHQAYAMYVYAGRSSLLTTTKRLPCCCPSNRQVGHSIPRIMPYPSSNICTQGHGLLVLMRYEAVWSCRSAIRNSVSDHLLRRIWGGWRTGILGDCAVLRWQQCSFGWLVFLFEIVTDVLHLHPFYAFLAADILDQPSLPCCQYHQNTTMVSNEKMTDLSSMKIT